MACRGIVAQHEWIGGVVEGSLIFLELFFLYQRQRSSTVLLYTGLRKRLSFCLSQPANTASCDYIFFLNPKT